ncbi:amidohydrolase family protein [Lentimicrobium sp. S6]|uniref:amidohydrolase family protein n=1 Tax=Lentimicrobium sp. S6 TaxID=2735872 RepID=UPI001554B9D8|nr:amidohydrolase family protein [Lentimicrobium sp. S6]NPD44310.1 amidohydrolase family protein [Lentimicrobium sp. S6]
MSLILKNTKYINWETLEFSDTNIKVNEGIDESLAFFDGFDKISISEDDQIIDCQGRFVTKSFAVGHHHAYSALSRGMPAPKNSPHNFLEILQYIWWNLDKSLDKEMIEASALATAIACAKSGSTFVIDHHASPNHVKGSLEIMAKAFDKVGVDHLLCYEISDRDGIAIAEEGLEESEEYLNHHQALVGLHASFTVGDETMKRAADLMRKKDSGIHIHTAEDFYDQEQCLQKHGKRVVERLNEFGVLESSKSILGHCLHIDNKERDLIRDGKAFVVQNMESNLNNNVGLFNGKNLGDRIMLGTDGMHSDMIRSAQTAFFSGQAKDNIDFVSAYERFRKVHHYLAINGFKGDGENNLVILDYPSPTDFNQNNFLGHFIFGWSSNMVTDVISNGKLIIKDRILQTINEEEVWKFTKEQANRLWKKL